MSDYGASSYFLVGRYRTLSKTVLKRIRVQTKQGAALRLFRKAWDFDENTPSREAVKIRLLNTFVDCLETVNRQERQTNVTEDEPPYKRFGIYRFSFDHKIPTHTRIRVTWGRLGIESIKSLNTPKRTSLSSPVIE